TSRRFSKGYFGFDILGAIPFHRPTKWVQYTAPPAIIAGLRFSGVTKPDTSSICQQQCLSSVAFFGSTSS
ncbi:hypothetical protein, partial [Escherichia coli]